MATFYRWRKSTIGYTESMSSISNVTEVPGLTVFYAQSKPALNNGYYSLSQSVYVGRETVNLGSGVYVSATGTNPTTRILTASSGIFAQKTGDNVTKLSALASSNMTAYFPVAAAGAFVGYVYSMSDTAYPNGAVQDDYFYDQRTTVTSPTAPTELTYPNPITAKQATVFWNAATSETDAPVTNYEVSYATNGGTNWAVAGTTGETSLLVSVPTNIASIRFRVRAKDSNGQWGEYAVGSVVSVAIPPATPQNIVATGEVIEGQTVSVTWSAAVLATGYVLQRNTGAGWTQVYAGAATTFSEAAGHWPSLQYRVQATNNNGSSGWATSNTVTVLLAPTLTVPQQAMQGQSVTVNWTAVSGAGSYTLQRKADTDADWVALYSGANTAFSETAGTWTAVQYRVQAVFDGIAGSWATSASIPVISASALVISGTNGDLGTLINDVPYTISTDTGNQIKATITVNGAVIFSGNVGTGTANSIPVLDLVNGEGTIVIEASVTSGSSPVSAVRTWTYTKAPITFSEAGSVGQLTKEGANIWPKVLAECVRLPGGKTLDSITGFPCQIYAGSYTGTGTYGSGSKNVLTLPFKPLVVFVTSGSAGTTIPMVRPGTGAMNGNAALTVTWAETGVSWYSANAANQLNTAGTTYHYFAIG